MVRVRECQAAERSTSTVGAKWWLFKKRILPIVLTYSGLILAPSCFSISGAIVALFLLLLTGLGVTVGLHRLLTHRSFSTYRWIGRLFATLGALAFQGGVVDWVAIHRMHHAHGDTADDPHSPTESFWHGHFFWLFRYDHRVADESFRARYVKDLCKDSYLMFLENWSIALQGLLFLALYLIGNLVEPDLGLSWGVYGVFVRVAILQQIAWLVNSVSHKWGYRTYRTKDQSVNCWWLTLLALGEGWHNNHHAFPKSARFGLRWYEVDAGYAAIRGLQALRLVWDVVTPDEKIADRLAQ